MPSYSHIPYEYALVIQPLLAHRLQVDEVEVVRDSSLAWLIRRFGQWAITWNGRVHLSGLADDMDDKNICILYSHECYHVVQQREMGWGRFLLRYLREIVGSWWNVNNMPLEAGAYAFGARVGQAWDRRNLP